MEGNVPKLLKTAHITPLFKSGDKTAVNNYRPVSLTPIIAKIFETIFKDHIEAHLNRYEIISEYQHGFCKGKSTVTNMLQFQVDIATLSENSISISVIYTDLRKAFDTVPHDLLLLKLRQIGIKGKVNDWLKSFLDDRVQNVRINGKLSSTVTVTSGVPQGGVLSGMLFSIFINDLPRTLKTCQISLYADDAKIYSPVCSTNNIPLITHLERLDSLQFLTN